MPVLEVFYDYECPFCLRGHDNLEQLYPQCSGITIQWQPCEAHPRPETHGQHSDLCLQGMYFAADNGVDLWAYHRLMYNAAHVDKIDIENAESLAAYAGKLLDGAAFLAALKSGKYAHKPDENNNHAYVENGVWAVPSYRMDGRKLDAVEGVGVTKEQLAAFIGTGV